MVLAVIVLHGIVCIVLDIVFAVVDRVAVRALAAPQTLRGRGATSALMHGVHAGVFATQTATTTAWAHIVTARLGLLAVAAGARDTRSHCRVQIVDVVIHHRRLTQHAGQMRVAQLLWLLRWIDVETLGLHCLCLLLHIWSRIRMHHEMVVHGLLLLGLLQVEVGWIVHRRRHHVLGRVEHRLLLLLLLLLLLRSLLLLLLHLLMLQLLLCKFGSEDAVLLLQRR